MIKIAITGKANSGKNTAANLIKKNILDCNPNLRPVLMAFAEPLKEIASIMFPFISKKWLYGSSKLRDNIVKGILNAEGQPLTIRRLLIDIGTKFGRGYKDSIWLDNFEHRLQEKITFGKDLIILTDCRFINESAYLKNNNFFMVKIVRNSASQLSHVSETEQDQIPNSDFDFIIDNNSDLNYLKQIIAKSLVPVILDK